MRSQFSAIRTMAIAVLVGLPGTVAAQQNYPAKPIRWVTPYAPGGSTSALSRLVGEKLSESFGKPVIIDNRPGANTMIGGEAVARASPDGYTILLAGNSQIVLALLMKPPYNVFTDFAPVTILARTNYVLVVNPATPVNNLQEFIAYAKARPGQLNVASVSSGSSQHLMGELFGMLTDVKMKHIPYKGGAQGLTDLMGGHVQASFSNALNVIPHVKNGRLKGLAITGEKRAAALPQVPTYAEAGLPQYDPKNWQGVVAPARTPKPIIAKLSSEMERILAMPDVAEKLVNSGMDPYYTGPEKMAALMKADYAETARIIKTANIKIEE
ncbi:MAG TPA: tripartite tricarboxylate transporter substrate binding protein [Burkholderiales bacterium]|nr:tripartite tricarboxylate transporter substrate binding protein [Burkholderiales bacterium]